MQEFFVRRVFAIFDERKRGEISVGTYLDRVRDVNRGNERDKLEFLFKVYDVDATGFISHQNLCNVLKFCMQENGLTFSDADIERMARVLIEDAEQASASTQRMGTQEYQRRFASQNRQPRNLQQQAAYDHRLTFDGFLRLFERTPGLLENVARSVDQWLLPPLPKKRAGPTFAWLHKLRWSYIWEHSVNCFFMLAILSVCVALTAQRFYQYREDNIFVRLARAGGVCLNFTCSFILFLVLRKSITFLRGRGFSSFLPLDENIYFHKKVGQMIAGFSILHTLAHGANFYTRARSNGSLTTTEVMREFVRLYFSVRQKSETTDGYDLRPYTQVFGWALVLILFIMILTSLPFVRRSGWFEVFFFSHLLYIPFYLILLMHASKFYRWFAIPGSLFVMEGILRLIKSFGSQNTYVSQGVVLPSKVVNLIIKRPIGFTYNPGDWIFVQIPSIARMEWHPFTISSAPEMPDHIWLHIESRGQWTGQLHEYFQALDEKTKAATGLKRGASFVNRSLSFIRSRAATSMNNELSFISLNNVEAGVDVDDGRPIARLQRSAAGSGVRNRIRDRGPGPRNLGAQHPVGRMSSFRVPFDEKSSKMYVLPAPAAQELESKPFPGLRRGLTFRRKSDERNQAMSDISSLTVVSESEITAAANSLPNPAELLRSGRVLELEKPLVVRIDGPYGSPTTDIFQTEHAVLVGAGIGVTPFASILQSIMLRYMSARHTCPSCSHRWTDPLPPDVMSLKKVDFVWVNRNQRSFEWFVNLLSQLEMTQAPLKDKDRFLDMHTYVTSALEKSDMKAVGLQLALDLMYERHERDLITGLKTRSRAGRPNWQTFFQSIRNQNKGRVTVFFCGPEAMGRTLRSYCVQFKFAFRKEHF